MRGRGGGGGGEREGEGGSIGGLEKRREMEGDKGRR